MQRREEFEDWPGRHGPLARQRGQRLGPRTRGAHGEHLGEGGAGVDGTGEITPVQRASVTRNATQRFGKLEL